MTSFEIIQFLRNFMTSLKSTHVSTFRSDSIELQVNDKIIMILGGATRLNET